MVELHEILKALVPFLLDVSELGHAVLPAWRAPQPSFCLCMSFTGFVLYEGLKHSFGCVHVFVDRASQCRSAFVFDLCDIPVVCPSKFT